jgi:hypothetical protein
MEELIRDNFSNVVAELTERVTAKALAFSIAYIFVLEAQKAASDGHVDLKTAFTSLETTLKKSRMNAREYFRAVLFIDLISEIEIFFANIVKATIVKNPKKLGGAQFKLSDILDASSTDELITRAADEYIYKLMYKKPGEYLDEICNTLSIERTTISAYWPTYIEAKARRDLGVHNNWICNATYRRKLQEAGVQTTTSVGESLIPSDRDYAAAVSTAVASLAYELGKAVIDKHV